MITTKKHFEIFVKECKFWIEKLGLKGWSIYFTHRKSDNDSRANIWWKIDGRIATINLEPKWEEFEDTVTSTNVIVRQAAFHEVCELLLGRLAMMADGKLTNNRYATIEETHNIIRTLENTMFKDSLK